MITKLCIQCIRKVACERRRWDAALAERTPLTKRRLHPRLVYLATSARHCSWSEEQCPSHPAALGSCSPVTTSLPWLSWERLVSPLCEPFPLFEGTSPSLLCLDVNRGGHAPAAPAEPCLDQREMRAESASRLFIAFMSKTVSALCSVKKDVLEEGGRCC